jgi:hypothetical protein
VDVAEEAGSVMLLEEMTLMVQPVHGLLDIEVWVCDPARAMNQSDHLSAAVLVAVVQETIECAQSSVLQPRGLMAVLLALGT